jgi:hypothetical protein
MYIPESDHQREFPVLASGGSGAFRGRVCLCAIVPVSALFCVFARLRARGDRACKMRERAIRA